MPYQNSLKTPINKALLTPCRRVGLSRPKKTPKVLNLNSPTPINTSSPLTKPINDKKTQMKDSKHLDLGLYNPLNTPSPLARPLDNKVPKHLDLNSSSQLVKQKNYNTPLKISRPLKKPADDNVIKSLDMKKVLPEDSKRPCLELESPLEQAQKKTLVKEPDQFSGTSTPLKRSENKKSKKLFECTPKNTKKVKKNKVKEYEKEVIAIEGVSPEIEKPENQHINKTQNLHVKETIADDLENTQKEERQNENLIEKFKPTLNKAENEITKTEDIDATKLLQMHIETVDTNKNEHDIEKPVKIVVENEKLKENIGLLEIATNKKPPLFRKVTSSIKNRENTKNSPVPLGKFTTSDWLEDEEFSGFTEKQFEWKESDLNSQNNEDCKNFSSDSDEEIFQKKTVQKRKDSKRSSSICNRTNATKRKRKVLKIIDSSSDENMEDKKWQESVEAIRLTNEDSSDSDSGSEFSKGPIKSRKLSSLAFKSNQTSSTNNKTSVSDVVSKSKKFKKVVTVDIEKLSKSDIEKYNANIEGIQNKVIPNNKNEQKESDKEVVSPETDKTKEKQGILDQVNTIKALIKKKEQVLENLKQAEIYMNKHDPKKLEDVSNIWLNGCRLAIFDLLRILKEHGPITMKSLLVKLQVPLPILQKLNISIEEDTN